MKQDEGTNSQPIQSTASLAEWRPLKLRTLEFAGTRGGSQDGPTEDSRSGTSYTTPS